MSNGLVFYETQYLDTAAERLNELYSLRKEIFADRLNWKVSVTGQLEFDEYDNPDTTYLIGCWNGTPLAGLRLINTVNPYMVEGPFRSFFQINPPKKTSMAESSRFFVDTARTRQLGLADLPLTQMLLFTMHNHAEMTGLSSIITVVSKAMSRIVRNAGWQYSVLATGEASPGEKVLLLQMPVNRKNSERLLEAITQKCSPTKELQHWPLPLDGARAAQPSWAERSA